MLSGHYFESFYITVSVFRHRCRMPKWSNLHWVDEFTQSAVQILIYWKSHIEKTQDERKYLPHVLGSLSPL